ncbi:serine O-acetyltransferase [Flavihumibacter solisilvae]|jgi:serine O-acetyltransferase|uniref:serine O-acetyltransferase n=1 Tax=Flavihumibacter solisilvae TaxID=1349421 RepID=UPI00068C0E0F|nr:serine acetyltransferase [Flavihumibacter solisilvae]
MDSKIKADLYRYGGLTGVKGLFKGLMNPGFRYTFLLRKAGATNTYSPSGLLWRILLRHYSFKYGFQIFPSTQIGEGFYISHFGPIVINGKVKIGRNCNITHGVTLGQANRGSNMGCPELGDNVWLGTNAVLVGKIKVGSNVLVAPNAYVNFDVPDNSIVLGNPGKIIPKQNPVEGYIDFVLPSASHHAPVTPGEQPV